MRSSGGGRPPAPAPHDPPSPRLRRIHARSRINPPKLRQERRRMNLEALPPLRDSLAAYGLDARKSFGQHFLLDLNVTRKIARLAGSIDGGAVIEVGPGPGGLTRALLEAGARVIAVEKDRRFIPLLQALADAAD